MVLSRKGQSMEIPTKRIKQYVNAINKMQKILNSFGSYDNLRQRYCIGLKNNIKKDIRSFKNYNNYRASIVEFQSTFYSVSPSVTSNVPFLCMSCSEVLDFNNDIIVENVNDDNSDEDSHDDNENFNNNNPDEVITHLENEANQVQLSGANDNSNSCDNCRRRQSHILTGVYQLDLHLYMSNQVRAKRKFKFCRSHRSENAAVEVVLCTECAHHLVEENESKEANSSQFTWPGFIWSLFTSDELRNTYGDFLWMFIPSQWRHWWVDAVRDSYGLDITVNHPPPIFIDHTLDLNEFNADISSFLLARLRDTCNKPSFFPNVLCPWGCQEFKHRYVEI